MFAVTDLSDEGGFATGFFYGGLRAVAGAWGKSSGVGSFLVGIGNVFDVG